MKPDLISVVVPLYNEEDLVAQLHAQVVSSMNGLGRPWEVIYVNDGSRDGTLGLLLERQAHDPHVVVVNLSRNWGHQPALTAGLSVARGGAVVLMDGDLQDPPRSSPPWSPGGRRVPMSSSPSEGAGPRAASGVSSSGSSTRSWPPSPTSPSRSTRASSGSSTGRSPTRSSASARRTGSSRASAPGSATRPRSSPMIAQERAAGEPKQRLGALVRYACNAIFGFSNKPLRLSYFLGTSAILFAMLLAAASALRPATGGWAGASAAFLMGGVQLVCAGILGEYIGRVYDEVRHRPLFLIQDVYPGGARGNDALFARPAASPPFLERAEPRRPGGDRNARSQKVL